MIDNVKVLKCFNEILELVAEALLSCWLVSDIWVMVYTQPLDEKETRRSWERGARELATSGSLMKNRKLIYAGRRLCRRTEARVASPSTSRKANLNSEDIAVTCQSFL